MGIEIESQRGMSLTSKQRFLRALEREVPDRLPVTTHHVMDCFLETALGGISVQDFFDRFGLDPILWVVAHRADAERGAYDDPGQGTLGFLEAPHLRSDAWRIEKSRYADFDARVRGGTRVEIPLKRV